MYSAGLKHKTSPSVCFYSLSTVSTINTRTSCLSRCDRFTLCLCIQACLLNDLCDHRCDRGITSSPYLVASSTLDGLPGCKVIAPMTPRLTQTTSYQRDALYWRAETLTALNRAGFQNNTACLFLLSDGLMHGRVKQVSTVRAATGYQVMSWLHAACLHLNFLSKVALHKNTEKPSLES